MMIPCAKYMAGFIDADGFLSLRTRIGARPDMAVEVAQRAKYADVIYRYKTSFGGHIREGCIRGGYYVSYAARGCIANMLIDCLSPHFICKHKFANSLVRLAQESSVLHREKDVEAVRKSLDALRHRPPGPDGNLSISGGWLAGYFDGDGSFTIKVCKKTGYAYPVAAILSAPQYCCGIRTLRGAFGGAICRTGGNILWQLQLSKPSNAQNFLRYFIEYLVIKRAQAQFLLGCATAGNFRDGSAIRNAIMTLNSSQEKSSNPDNEAAALLNKIRFDKPMRPLGRPPGRIETRPRQMRQPS